MLCTLLEFVLEPLPESLLHKENYDTIRSTCYLHFDLEILKIVFHSKFYESHNQQ